MKPGFLFVFLYGAALLLSQDASHHSGIDGANLDPNCKPCADFWRYANGGWMDKNPIPARYASWGPMNVMAQTNRERLHAILESAFSDASAQPGSNERKIADFYASCMDTSAIAALGVKPLQPDLDRIARIRSVKDLTAALAAFQRTTRIGPFAVRGQPDMKNSSEVIANIDEEALSLPERDYYFKEDSRSQEIRGQFEKHAARMFGLLGDKPEAAAAEAKTVVSFETALASVIMTNVQRRDPYSRYHRLDLAGVSALTPDFDWKPALSQFQIAESTPINVVEPEFLKKVNAQLTAAPLEDWKTWLRWRLVSGAAPHLSQSFFDEDFNFRSTALRGVKEQAPRWETCTIAIDNAMGEALGELFVRKYFPPEAKRRMNELIGNLRATLREELDAADWLTPETRKNAVAKLEGFVAKIGYPDKWRDYSAVKIDRKTFFENVRAAAVHNRLYQIAKIGKPVNRGDWNMTPPTVNAYYNSRLNEIVFPAGILQPPMFDLSADDAVNYGAIGAVIGHEMGHGFDDQGSKFDAQGNLKNWWAPSDRERFEERAACVIDQFDKLDVGDGLRHKGKLVVGEALGDLGGLKLAYRAYQRSLRGKPAPPVMDGFTADQRFFLAFARIWGRQSRPEDLRLQINTNPHPVARFRVIGTLQNMPEFHQAFGCKNGDPMVRPPETRCKLW